MAAKFKNVVLMGFDPGFREYGFTAAVFDYSTRKVNFFQFRRYIQFDKWIRRQAAFYHGREFEIIVGIENSYLVKKYFDIDFMFETYRTKKFKDEKEKRKFRSMIVNKIEGAAMNRAISHAAADLLKHLFDNVFEFKPAKSGPDATGGKKSHNDFFGAVRFQGFEIGAGYKKPKVVTKPTEERGQDMIDAGFIALYSKDQFNVEKQRIGSFKRK